MGVVWWRLHSAQWARGGPDWKGTRARRDATAILPFPDPLSPPPPPPLPPRNPASRLTCRLDALKLVKLVHAAAIEGGRRACGGGEMVLFFFVRREGVGAFAGVGDRGPGWRAGRQGVVPARRAAQRALCSAPPCTHQARTHPWTPYRSWPDPPACRPPSEKGAGLEREGDAADVCQCRRWRGQPSSVAWFTPHALRPRRSRH